MRAELNDLEGLRGIGSVVAEMYLMWRVLLLCSL